MKYRKKRIMAAVIGIMILSIYVLPVLAWEGECIRTVGFGDSIAFGYSGDGEEIQNYPSILARELETACKLPVENVNYAKNGLTTTKLNNTILTNEDVLADIESADVITLTIGANDLMNEFKKAAQEILNLDRKFRSADDAIHALQEGISHNPLIIVKIINVISNWDYEAFEVQWTEAVSTITEHQKEESQLIITNIYNPVGKMELPGTLNSVIEKIISKMNDIMVKHEEEYGYQIVDLFQEEMGENTQSDGLHPNQEGQNLIAEKILNVTDVLIFQEEPEILEAESEKEVTPVKKKSRENTAVVIIMAANMVAVSCVLILSLREPYLKKKKEQNTDHS